MISLAIDTSGATGSVSVARAGTILAARHFGEHESHMREIATAVDRTLSWAGLKLDDVQRIAFVSGPGSFTGLRIGMAFVKGLHAASGIPVVTINSLELLALPLIQEYALVLSMIDAHKEQVYAALYRSAGSGENSGNGAAVEARATGQIGATCEDEAAGEAVDPVIEPSVAAPEKILSEVAHIPEYIGNDAVLICAGSGTSRYSRHISDILGGRALHASEKLQFPSTDILAVRAAAMRPIPEELLLALEPFYIRSSDAELKRLKEVKTDG